MYSNVFMITIDNIRADKFEKNSTCKIPNLNNLIKNGIIFRQAISGSDGTTIGLSNIFTGNYSVKSQTKTYDFNKNTITFFDELQKLGYHLIGCVPELHYLKHISSKFTESEIYSYVDRSSYKDLFNGLGDKIVQKLKTKKNHPWFFYMHLMDAKPPFTLPKEYDSQVYGDSITDRILSAIDSWIGKFLKEIDLENTLIVISSDHGNFIPIDEKGINSMPNTVKNIMKSTKNSPIPESIKTKSYVQVRNVVRFFNKNKLKNLTGYEKRSFETRTKTELFDELIRIPLIFSGLGLHQNEIKQQVRQIDIFPTIFEILGIKSTLNFQGESLFPLIQGKTMQEKSAFIENSILLDDDQSENFFNEENLSKKQYGKFIGIRTSTHKYQRTRESENGFVSLYDLRNDPKELKNIANFSKNKLNEMEEILLKILNDKTLENESEDNFLSEKEKKSVEDELKKLGYI